ncbi:hypothetical protein TH53_08370 [Pedobacter lusitanus]|uniref:Acyltransferase 3 domain-containing protein n=2 Tax=Pedobacter lusitanus TaxID=1503925 RepID=A0A0D0GT68_9SPHI|nr:hypothetical protein TH53_08370 [Pedobacter lusitanus]
MTLPAITDRLHGLDHLRAFAIIFVFIFHYGRLFYAPQPLISIGKFGWTGVDLFFVLSGYLIASHLFKGILTKGINFRVFYTKRIFRIIPVYLVILLLYFLFPSFREREALAPLWKYLTFTQNIGLDLRSQGTFSHAWSLCIEEQFYLLFPLMLWILVYSKRIDKIFTLLLILFLSGFIFRLYTWTNFVSPFIGTEDFVFYWYKWIYYLTLCRLDGLITGILIAAIFEFMPMYRSRIEPFGNRLLIISVLVLTAAYYLCENEESFSASVFGFPLISLGYGMLLLGAICPGSLLYNFRSGFMRKIADLSFAIYLCHKIVLHLSQEQSGYFSVEKDSWVMFTIGLFATISVAYILNILIEKPFMKIRNILLKRMGH